MLLKRPINVFVQDPVNLTFLCGRNSWSKNAARALDFANSTEAITFCSKHPVKSYQILLRFSDPSYNIVLRRGLPARSDKRRQGSNH